jgi:phosphatidate cytidylyltransferase
MIGKGSISSMAFGAIYTSLPFGCFVWIREMNPDGQVLLLSILAIVVTTDVGAYFAGRGFGGPLLSPKDSPNKTWTGAIGALVCAGLAGAAVARAGGGDFFHWLMFGLALSVVAQLGDLLESRFKRLYGVKDTSGLLPGHGGVLDRLDGLMAATVAAALIIRFVPALAPSLSHAGAP